MQRSKIAVYRLIFLVLLSLTLPAGAEPFRSCAVTGFTLEHADTFWKHPIDTYGESKVNLSNALQLGKLKSLTDTTLSLEYSQKDSFHSTWFKKNIRTVEEQFRDHFKTAVSFSITEVESEDDEAAADTKSMDRETIGKNIKADPLINKLVDELGLELS